MQPNVVNPTSYLFPVPHTAETDSSATLIIPHDGLSFTFETEPSLLSKEFVKKLGFDKQSATAREVIARIDKNEMSHEQGFWLKIDKQGIELIAADDAGLYYGIQTLANVVEHATKCRAGLSINCMQIKDWPDFPTRAYLLDVSRNRVPTMETLFYLIDRLAKLRINQVQLYIEHTFAYTEHKKVWKNASPITARELSELDTYCRSKGIELVPNQNSLAHMHRWVAHKSYKQLSEHPDKIDSKYLKNENYQHEGNPGYSLCPQDAKTVDLIASLHAEQRRNVQSHKFNCGLDEPIDLGINGGRSVKEMHRGGMDAVFGNYLRQIYSRLKADDPDTELQFWADAILFEPEVLDNLPKDSVLLLWGYEPDFPFGELGKRLSSRNLKWYVCPSTCDWSSIGGRTENAIANLSKAALDGYNEHAAGYMITEWGDNGHHQPLAVGFLGLALGANFAWNASQAQKFDLERLKPIISQLMFGDPTGIMGEIAAKVGSLYQTVLGDDTLVKDCSALFRLLVFNNDLPDTTVLQSLSMDGLKQALKILDDAKVRLPNLSSGIDKQSFANIEEYKWVIDTLAMSCRFGLLLLTSSWQELTSLKQLPKQQRKAIAGECKALIDRFEKVWSLRNRKGGLEDSVRRLHHLVKLL